MKHICPKCKMKSQVKVYKCNVCDYNKPISRKDKEHSFVKYFVILFLVVIPFFTLFHIFTTDFTRENNKKETEKIEYIKPITQNEFILTIEKPTEQEEIHYQDNVEIIWNFFRSQGFNEISTASIIGNLQQESTLNIEPDIIEWVHEVGFGIAQWSFCRRTELEQTALKYDTCVTDLDFQIQFMWDELNSWGMNLRFNGEYTEWANYGIILQNADVEPLTNGLNEFKEMTDLEWAVILFERVYFRAGEPKIENRIEFAQNALERFRNNNDYLYQCLYKS